MQVYGFTLAALLTRVALLIAWLRLLWCAVRHWWFLGKAQKPKSPKAQKPKSPKAQKKAESMKVVIKQFLIKAFPHGVAYATPESHRQARKPLASPQNIAVLNLKEKAQEKAENIKVVTKKPPTPKTISFILLKISRQLKQ